MKHLVVGLCVLAALGCASDKPSGTPMVRDVTAGAPEGSKTSAEGGRFGGVEQRASTNWKDTSEGKLATLVYVTEMRGKKGNQPGAMIFGSDPSSAHFHRRATPLFVVRRLYKSEMAWLHSDLMPGFESLPWIDEANYDASIGPARAFHYYEGGKRRYVLKDSLGHSDKRTFRQIEDRLLQLTFLR